MTPDRDVNICCICKAGKNDIRPKRGVHLMKLFVCDTCIELLGGYEAVGEIGLYWD